MIPPTHLLSTVALLATCARAIEFSVIISTAGDDCDHSFGSSDYHYLEVDGSQTMEVLTTAQCLAVGEDEYDVDIGWSNLSGQDYVPPIYACPDSSCSSGCALLWAATESSSTQWTSSCEHAYNAPYLLVDGMQNQ
ncbi:uncharacterized protein BO95DRAFT_436654 [Aspergillus brunneoviolaceus CBS 621.78]|uniref:Uncharacterized protein n=1 Tax=Aspergillus brunneoviolaceus CBS 621.78 TaxID=1450534 RepID=A0ACD1FU48_9EURO|nr:hypothetical protein BO95DRAFT_436654 [Aspergillus brunneoviolaceus CBS 621.78]RAH40456.1 hypothetical protein BO95DRAFT_436654 [Aspergillus brunneoviolaceus CBS 621.78]